MKQDICMDRVGLEMRGLRGVPDAELDSLSPEIRVRCDRMESRTLAYILVSIFSELFPDYEIHELSSVSDVMGSLEFNLHLRSDDYYMRIRYSQSISSTFHHVEIDAFTRDYNLPPGVSMRLDIDLTAYGRMGLSLHGIGESAAKAVAELADATFERVWPSGTADPRIKEVIGEL